MKRFALLAVIVSILICQSMAMAEEGQLWRLAGKKGSIKTYVKEVVNQTGNSRVNAEDLKNTIETMLVNRKSTKFEIAKSPGESDVEISIVIKKYNYMEKGPFNASPGIETTLLDAAETMSTNYVDMTANFIVMNSKTGMILWNETLDPYIKKRMTSAESLPVIYEKMAKHFIWKCFGKPAN